MRDRPARPKRRTALALFAALILSLAPTYVPNSFASPSGGVQIHVQLSQTRREQVSFSPTGDTFVTVSDQSIIVWNAEKFRQIRSFKVTTTGSRHAAYSPDGRLLALCGDWQENFVLVEVASGATVKTLKGSAGSGVAFTRDGKQILASDEKGIHLWDIGSAKILKTFHGYNAGAPIAVSPDGTSIVSVANSNGVSKTKIRSWNLADGRTSTLISLNDNLAVESLRFSADGRQLVVGGLNSVAVYDVATKRLVRTLDKTRSDVVVNAAEFSPDGSRIVSCDSTGLKVWDTASGRRLQFLKGEDSFAAYAPDGKIVVWANTEGTFALDGATWTPARSFRNATGQISAMAFSSSGDRLLALQNSHGFDVWDPQDGRGVRLIPVGKFGIGDLGMTDSFIAFSPKQDLVVSGPYSVGNDYIDQRYWDAITGRLVRDVKGTRPFAAVALAAPIAVTEHMDQGDDTGQRSELTIWNIETGKALRTLRGPDMFGQVALSPDGGTMVVWNISQRLDVWDVDRGRRTRQLRTEIGAGDSQVALAISPRGKLLAVGTGYGDVLIVDLSTGKKIGSIKGRSNSNIAFSPDGKKLAMQGEAGLEIWSSDGATRLASPAPGDGGDVSSLLFLPSGNGLVTGGNDGTVRYWGLDGKLLATSIYTDDGDWLTITPEGFFDASEKGATLLNVVKGIGVETIDQVYDALHRPDLVREKLAGDPQGLVIKAAAALNLDTAIASGPPPRLSIDRTGETLTTTNGRITIDGRITDAGGGIGKIEWRVNGVTLATERGLAPLDVADEPDSSDHKLHQTLPVRSGRNIVDVRVYNKAGLVASEPVVVVVQSNEPARPPRLFVLAAGIDEYEDDALRLEYSVADARAIGAALNKAGTGLYANVEVTTLVDKDVTTAALDAAFAALGKRISPDDVFVFYIAGHGTTVDGRYYFLPWDFRYNGQASVMHGGVGQDRWQDWLRRIPAQKSILLYDTCDSGALTAQAFASRGLEKKTALDFLTRATGRTTFTAATGDQAALEGYHGHGVFTYAVLDAIDKGDLDADGRIDLDELITYVNRVVPEISERAFHARQFPQLARSGGNFPIVNRTVVLGEDAATAAIPKSPTHVVISSADVHSDAVETSGMVVRLSPGTQVRLIETHDGWTLIGRDGQKLGYVKAGELVELH